MTRLSGSLFSRTAWIGCVVLVAVLVACNSTGQPVQNPEGTAGFVAELRNQPTLPAPAWVEGAEVVTLENAPNISYIGRLDTASSAPSTVFAYAFSPDATRLVGLNNEQLIAWDLITGQIVFNTAREDATSVFYGSEKTEIYTIDQGGLIAIYDADVGRREDTLTAHPQYNEITAYYADTGWMALGGLDGSVKVWEPGLRQSLVTFEAGGRGITALTFSPDGEWLATGNEDGTIQVWDWRNKALIGQFEGVAFRLIFSPDGTQVAAGTASKIDIWNIADGSMANSLATGPGGTTDVFTYSPNGDFLLNGGSIPSVTVWDAASGQLVNTLPGVGGDRTSAAFAPDAALLATSVLGGSVSLWDVTSLRGQTLNRADLNVGTRQILTVAWSDDGHLLLIFDATGPIQVWGIAAGVETTS